MQVARSSRGAGACELWQLAQVTCTECKPLRVPSAWHVVQVGGFAGPFGPCGRWHVAHASFVPWP
jgi:hypothetical protein